MDRKKVVLSIIFSTTIGLIALSTFDQFSEKNGFIKGNSESLNEDVFSIIAEKFELTISEFNSEGHNIQLTIPVSEITTDNWLRDIHMLMSVLDTSIGDITFFT